MPPNAAKVTLSNSNCFFGVEGKSILDSAKTVGLILEHSCRTGKCGLCKAQVIRGDTSLIQQETSLTLDELSKGMILTCCRAAESDLHLNIRDLGELANIQIQTLPCKIDSIEVNTIGVARIFLRLPPNNSFNCLPGQYVNIVNSSGVRRSYSIANYFPAEKKIELQIRQVENGAMSHFWFNSAKTSDLLRFDGPHGTFFFRPMREKRIIFLATGTGIAPIKSILEQFENHPELISNKTVEVYWGNRTSEEFYWTPQFEVIKIDFTLVVSRKHSCWKGKTGYVQDAAISNNSDLDDAVVYASGSPEMINSAKALFALKGLKEDCFFSDAFYNS